MTEKEFVKWLQGYTKGVHHYSINPKQWQILKDKLATVNKSTKYQIDPSVWTTTVAYQI